VVTIDSLYELTSAPSNGTIADPVGRTVYIATVHNVEDRRQRDRRTTERTISLQTIQRDRKNETLCAIEDYRSDREYNRYYSE